MENRRNVGRPTLYATDKELVDDCVTAFLRAGDSALLQARGDSVGVDGITSERATQNARLFWSAMKQARLFTIHPERWKELYTLSDRFVEEQLCGQEWSPADPNRVIDAAEEARAKKVMETYEEQGTHWPFPDPMPFDACFFGYGRRFEISRSPVAFHTRMTPEEWHLYGSPRVFLLGHLLAWSGDTPYAFTVIEFGESREAHAQMSINAGEIAFICSYLDGEWFQPHSLDPWILSMLVRTINEHKKIIQDYRPTLGQRLNRKKASKRVKQLLPLPAPFYMVSLKDELLVSPQKAPTTLPGRPVEWSHRWDVRGHECVRIERGELPLADKERVRLKKREYRIYEGMSLSGDDANRLLKRGVRAPGPREWVAVLSYWREAMVKGPADKPYIPGARIGA